MQNELCKFKTVFQPKKRNTVTHDLEISGNGKLSYGGYQKQGAIVWWCIVLAKLAFSVRRLF